MVAYSFSLGIVAPLATQPNESFVRHSLLRVTEHVRRRGQNISINVLIGESVNQAVMALAHESLRVWSISGITIDGHWGRPRGHLRACVQIASMVEGLVVFGNRLPPGLHDLVGWAERLGTKVRHFPLNRPQPSITVR